MASDYFESSNDKKISALTPGKRVKITHGVHKDMTGVLVEFCPNEGIAGTWYVFGSEFGTYVQADHLEIVPYKRMTAVERRLYLNAFSQSALNKDPCPPARAFAVVEQYRNAQNVLDNLPGYQTPLFIEMWKDSQTGLGL